MSDLDPEVSKFFSEMAKKRKNPYLGFKENKERASEAGKLGAKKRWEKKKQDDNSTPAN